MYKCNLNPKIVYLKILLNVLGTYLKCSFYLTFLYIFRIHIILTYLSHCYIYMLHYFFTFYT